MDDDSDFEHAFIDLEFEDEVLRNDHDDPDVVEPPQYPDSTLDSTLGPPEKDLDSPLDP
jgi:hypothetical protein